MPRDRVHADRLAQLTAPFSGGESWQEAVGPVGQFLADLLPRWDGARVLVVGHFATQLGLDHHLRGVALTEALSADFTWQPGCEYVPDPALAAITELTVQQETSGLPRPARPDMSMSRRTRSRLVARTKTPSATP
jgi:broad specificity phosphatase PhoE